MITLVVFNNNQNINHVPNINQNIQIQLKMTYEFLNLEAVDSQNVIGAEIGLNEMPQNCHICFHNTEELSLQHHI